MVDVSVLPPVVEAQYDGSTWTDVTDDLRSLEAGHGGTRHANPDRPTVASATGSIILSGQITDRTRGRRFRCRVRLGSTVLLDGWLQEPEAAATADPAVRWRVAGRLGEYLQQAAKVTAAARTVAATLADSTLWTGLVGAAPSSAGLTARALLAYSFDGRTGRYISQLAAVAGAEAVERLDGTLRLTASTLTTEPDGTPTLDNLAVIVNKVTSRDRADRIRNQAPGGDPTNRTTSVDLSITAPTALPPGPELVGTATFTIPDGGRVETAEVTSVAAGRRVPTGYINVTRWPFNTPQNTANPSQWNAWGLEFGWEDVAGAIATVSLSGAVTADIPNDALTDRVTGLTAVGAPTVGSGAPSRTQILRGWAAQSEQAGGAIHNLPQIISDWTSSIETWAQSAMRVYGLRATVQIAYSTVDVIEDTASVARWGERPLVLADWLAAATDLRAQITQLAQLRHEHTIEVPLRQPTAAAQALVAGLDAGDYVSVVINDPGRNIAINAVCLVTGRSIVYTPRTGPVLRFRCLETGATPGAPTQAPATPTGLQASATSQTAVSVGCDVTATAASYQFRYRTGSGSWTTVNAGSTPSAAITGLTSSTTYEVQVRATNTAGSSAWSTSVSVTTLAPANLAPGIPTAIVATAGDGQVTLMFSPGTGGAPTSYRVWYDTDGTITGATEVTPPPTSSPVVVTGLTNDTGYDFWLAAVNSAGQSGISTPVSATPVAAPVATVPAAPAAPTLTPGDGQLGVEWAAPDDGGAAISDYDVQYRVTSGQWTSWPHTGTTRSATITGLTNDTTYDVRIRAVNSVGPSGWGQAASAAPTSSVLDPPTGVSVTVLGDTSARISWTAVPAATGYRVEWGDDTSYDIGSWQGVGASGDFTMSNLQAGTDYYVRIRAVDATTTSSWVNRTFTTTGGTPTIDPPVVPRNVALVVGDGQLLLRWDAPNTGSAQTGYHIEWAAGVQEIGSQNAAADDLNYTITNLTNGTEYTVRIRATNSAGNSAYVTVRATPVLPNPDPPTGLTLTVGDGQLVVSWTAPAAGGAVRDYRIEWAEGVSPEGNHTLTATSYTITGLTNGTEYTVRVRSQNTSGNSAYVTARATPVDPSLTFDGATIDDQAWTQNQPVTQLVLPAAIRGTAPITYTLTPALPAGLTFTAATRTISGTPTAAADSATYTYTATDSASPAESVTLTFEIVVAAASVRGKPTAVYATGFDIGTDRYRTISVSYTPPAGYSISTGSVYQFQWRVGTGAWTLASHTAANSHTITYRGSTTPYEARVRVLVRNNNDALDTDWTEWSDPIDVTDTPSASEDSPIFVPLAADGVAVLADSGAVHTTEPNPNPNPDTAATPRRRRLWRRRRGGTDADT